jgi:hypothetical protein
MTTWVARPSRSNGVADAPQRVDDADDRSHLAMTSESGKSS